MKRTCFALATLAILLTVTLWGQEPQRFIRGIEILNGNLFLGPNGQICFEGATGNAFETCLTVTDPTADRTLTWPDSTGTAVLSGGSAPFLDDDAMQLSVFLHEQAHWFVDRAEGRDAAIERLMRNYPNPPSSDFRTYQHLLVAWSNSTQWRN